MNAPNPHAKPVSRAALSRVKNILHGENKTESPESRKSTWMHRADDSAHSYSATPEQFQQAAERAAAKSQPKQEPLLVNNAEFETVDFTEEEASFDPPPATQAIAKARPRPQAQAQPQQSSGKLQEINHTTGEITETDLTAPKMVMSMDTLKRVEDTLKRLDQMAPGRSLKTAYLKFDQPGEYIRGVFVGFRMINKPGSNGGELLKSACVMAPDGYTYLNAGTELVQQFDEVNLYDPVQIEFVGTKRTSNANTMKLYSVSVLIEGEEIADYVEVE